MLEVGLDDYTKLRGKLQEAGDRKLKARTTRRLRIIAQPMGVEVVREGSQAMPGRGGLRDHLISDGKAGISQTGKGVAIRLSSATAGLAALNRGVLRHPVYRTGKWVAQSVPADSYTDVFQRKAPEVRAAVAAEIRQVLKEL